MPTIAKQSPVAASNGRVAPATSVPGIVSARSLKRSWQKVLIYGRQRVGKSTLSAQWPKPLLAIACEPRENGGADSLIGMEGVDIAVCQLTALSGEMEAGSLKVLSIYQQMKAAVDATGKCPYQTLTLDVTALQSIVLAEIMGWSSVDTIIKRPKRGESGGVGFPVYMERATRMIGVLSKIADLPCNVIFLGQEKDHNPAKDEDGNAVEGKLVRTAQERSFMSVSLGQGTTEWLQNACQYIHQLYMDAEVQATTTMVDVAGTPQQQTVYAQTGRFVRRLRCAYHCNYAAGMTSSTASVVPEYIEADPLLAPIEQAKGMYDDLMRVVNGQKALRGKY